MEGFPGLVLHLVKVYGLLHAPFPYQDQELALLRANLGAIRLNDARAIFEQLAPEGKYDALLDVRTKSKMPFCFSSYV